MTIPTSKAGGNGGSSESGPAGYFSPPDHAAVLVIGRSQVNRVVVGRIVERAGLRPVLETPEEAERHLASDIPGLVILDGGSDNRDCEALMERLALLRERSPDRTPAVIFLSTRKIDGEELAKLVVVDAVVAKPILPEMLQPVVDRLMKRDRV
jgi:CheY-like chemotaxis protein